MLEQENKQKRVPYLKVRLSLTALIGRVTLGIILYPFQYLGQKAGKNADRRHIISIIEQ